MAFVIYQVKGNKVLRFDENSWKTIVALIELSEVPSLEDIHLLYKNEGLSFSQEQCQQIAHFIRFFLADHSEGDLFELEEEPREEAQTPVYGKQGHAVRSACAVSRKRLMSFAEFCENAEEGISIW